MLPPRSATRQARTCAGTFSPSSQLICKHGALESQNLPGRPKAHLFAPVQDGAGPTVVERGVVRFTLRRCRDCELFPR
jgi:hypothetical protein